MIMPARHEEPKNRTLSGPFVTAMIHAALMIRRGQEGWKAVVRAAFDAEFPSDAGMRSFAEVSFSEIVGLLLKGHRVIHIHRSLSHGLELFTGDGYSPAPVSGRR